MGKWGDLFGDPDRVVELLKRAVMWICGTYSAVATALAANTFFGGEILADLGISRQAFAWLMVGSVVAQVLSTRSALQLPPRQDGGGGGTLRLVPVLLALGLLAGGTLACAARGVDRFYAAVEAYNVPLVGAVSWLESPASRLHPEEADRLRAVIAEGDQVITSTHRGIQACQERALLEVVEGFEQRCIAALALDATSARIDELLAEMEAERAAAQGGK